MRKKLTWLNALLITICFCSSLYAESLPDINNVKTQIVTKIKQSDFQAADAAIAKMKIDFAVEPKLPDSMFGIAAAYESEGQYAKANSLYVYIAASFPNYKGTSAVQLQIAKLNICDLIAKDDLDSAQVAMAKMRTDFANNRALSGALYKIARTYEISQKYQYARTLYDSIAVTYPASSVTPMAKLGSAKLLIYSLISTSHFDEADDAVTKIKHDFAADSALSSTLYGIARNLDSSGQDSRAKDLFKSIATDYPNSPVAANAKLNLAKSDIAALIKAGNFSDAESAINKMKTEYAAASELPQSLYNLALTYESVKQRAKASEIFEAVADGFPQSSYANSAKMNLALFRTVALIKFDDVTAADVAVAKIKTDFAANAGLQRVMSVIAEKYYHNAAKAAELGNYTFAAQAFECAYQANPTDSSGEYWLFMKAECLEKAKSLQKAQLTNEDIAIAYKKMLEIFPNSSLVPAAKSRVYALTNEK